MTKLLPIGLLALTLMSGMPSSARSAPGPEIAPASQPTDATSLAHEADSDSKPLAAPVQGYVSKGIYSRFCFGIGVHIGVNAITAKKPLLGGVSAHFRASGIAGITVEYDFNRVAEEPTAPQLLNSAKYLHFLPNLRVAAVIVPYRWRMLGPFVLIGMGFDTEAKSERSTNIQAGLGLEGTFWKNRLALVGEARFFIPLPSDVERHRERVLIAGATTATGSAEYYNLKNALFTLSFRYYY